jgi:hypothetical protein
VPEVVCFGVCTVVPVRGEPVYGVRGLFLLSPRAFGLWAFFRGLWAFLTAVSHYVSDTPTNFRFHVTDW